MSNEKRETKEKNNTKHSIYLPARDKQLTSGAKDWVLKKKLGNNKKDYEDPIVGETEATYSNGKPVRGKKGKPFIKLKPSNKLEDVSPDSVLYISCHGGYGNNLSINLPKGRSIKITPQEMASHLEKEGLNKEHKVIKLFACYGVDNGSAKSLCDALYKIGYKKIEVYGYKGEVQTVGFDGHKTAGLPQGKIASDYPRAEWEKNHRASNVEQGNRVRYLPSAFATAIQNRPSPSPAPTQPSEPRYNLRSHAQPSSSP